MMDSVAKSEKMTPKVWILSLFIFLFPYQANYIHAFSDTVISHASCFYNEIPYCLFDLFFVALFVLAVRKWRSFLFKKETLFLLSFFVLASLSIVSHRYVTHALPLWHLLKLFCSSLLFFLLIAEGSSYEKKKLLQIMLYVIVIAALIQSAFAIYQYFNQKSLKFFWLGESLVSAKRGIGAMFPMADGSRWIFDQIFHIDRKVPMILRTYGTFTHPNGLGIFLVVALVSLYPLFSKASKKGKYLLGAIFFVLFFTLCITYSRASLFTWVIASLSFFIVQRRGKTIIPLIIGTVVVCGALLYPQVLKRGGVISSTPVNKAADTERVMYQNISWEMLKAHPLQGLGFQNYVGRMDDFSNRPLSEGEAQPVHNLFLLVATEGGIGALALLLMFLLSVFLKGWKGRRDITTAALLSLFVGFMFHACCDHFLLSLQHGRILFFLVLGLLVLSSQVAKEQADLPLDAETSQSH